MRAGTYKTSANIVNSSFYVHPLAPVPSSQIYNDSVTAFYNVDTDLYECSRWVSVKLQCRLCSLSTAV